MAGRCVLFVVLLLAACSGANPAVDQNTPRLLGEATLPPRTAAPLDAAPPSPIVATLATSVPELVSPLEVVTIESNFVLVTPTLPPTKTPTITPTISPTPSQTPPPTISPFPSATIQVFSTSVSSPVPAVIQNPQPQVCNTAWFFPGLTPGSCPLSPPTASAGVYQPFEFGHMIWVQQLDAVYVLYDTSEQPRWQVFNDAFENGMAETIEEFDNPPPAAWQPRRGFGLIWREREAMRRRIGWAIIEWEVPYSVQMQTGSDGTLFINMPDNAVFMLLPNGQDWARYSLGTATVTP